MNDSATHSYIRNGGARDAVYGHALIGKALKQQLAYAQRWQDSNEDITPVRAGMYPREAHHIGTVVGQQIAMQERGAQRWKRVLHPELSVQGPCAQCAADAQVTHSMDEPFFEFHPGGYCGAQGLYYDHGESGVEMPIALSEKPREFVARVTRLWAHFRGLKDIFRRK